MKKEVAKLKLRKAQSELRQAEIILEMQENGVIELREDIENLEAFINKKTEEEKHKKEHDTPICEKCGGRTAIVTGTFYYYPDTEPYKNGKEEGAKIESGDCWAGGFKCDECGEVQGIWTE